MQQKCRTWPLVCGLLQLQLYYNNTIYFILFYLNLIYLFYFLPAINIFDLLWDYMCIIYWGGGGHCNMYLFIYLFILSFIHSSFNIHYSFIHFIKIRQFKNKEINITEL